MVRWQEWPKSDVDSTFITHEMTPDLETALTGTVVRAPIVEGEPLTNDKFVHADAAGFMAATLSPGMRAVSITITTDSGAGGFILPNDRVDVLLSDQISDTPAPLPRARRAERARAGDGPDVHAGQGPESRARQDRDARTVGRSGAGRREGAGSWAALARAALACDDKAGDCPPPPRPRRPPHPRRPHDEDDDDTRATSRSSASASCPPAPMEGKIRPCARSSSALWSPRSASSPAPAGAAHAPRAGRRTPASSRCRHAAARSRSVWCCRLARPRSSSSTPTRATCWSPAPISSTPSCARRAASS